MITLLLLLVPLLSGLLLFAIKNEKSAKQLALLSSLVTLTVSILGLTCMNKPVYLNYDADWMPSLGSRFTVRLDGMGQLLCLLTAIAFPLIFISTWNNAYKNASRFFALMLLSQAGLIGVFMAMDALLFYFFWELALIPVYFLCSIWGGERRIQVTFKFFVYTFAGSLLMLTGLIWIYINAGQSFSLEAFYSHSLQPRQQYTIFWLLFLAFAIKMPIFPFHTWQPDTYEQSPTAVTMVLSGIMVKMGVFGLLRWVVPVVPAGSWAWGDTVTFMAIAGMLYASLLAIQQDDLKRLVAYSSIAHIGLMCAAVFATTKSGMQGTMIQMFNHGINIIGLWIVVNVIEQQFGTRRMSELGGIAQKAPTLTILLVIIALGNIALPLTNGFIGEFLMFNGIFASGATRYNVVFTVLALISIILAAVYTLNMIQKVFYGNMSANVEAASGEIRFHVKLALSLIAVLIILLGVYPAPMLSLTSQASDFILSKMHLIK